MNNAFEDRMARGRVSHEIDEHDSIVELSDLTKKRIHVSEFPYSAIAYDAEENYRKTGVDINSESLIELGKGIQNSGLQQPIALLAHDMSAIQLKEILQKGPDVLKMPDVWGRISMIFGNRRYLSIKHHTTLTHEGAFIYPREISSWVGMLQLIENRDREDVPLAEEAMALYTQVTERFDGVLARYAKFSGEKPADVSRIYQIGAACQENSDYLEIVKESKIKDKVALSYIAAAITGEASDLRKSKIKRVLAELKGIEGNVDSIRKKAQQLNEYRQGKNNKPPEIQEKGDNENPEPRETIKSTSQIKPVNIKQFSKQLSQVVHKFDRLKQEEVTDELKEVAASIRATLDKLGL